jgi:hypothetical protein
MAALTVGIVIADACFLHSERIITHVLLGGITTGIFYVLCNHGYEMINWVFLLIVPVYVLISIITTTVKSAVEESDGKYEDEDNYSSCGTCGELQKSCSCVKRRPPPPPPTHLSCGDLHTAEINTDNSIRTMNPYTGAAINSEDPTPMTRNWYHNLRNI